jgi:divalent metal cation (Fe/Co/Zn/Cd) transporter
MSNPLIAYIVLGLSVVFEGGAWFFALREFGKTKGNLGYVEAVNRGKDPSMFVVLFEDSAALLGLLVALIGITLAHLTGLAWFDGLASIVIGLILGVTAIWLAAETKSLLIGEAASGHVIRGIRSLLREEESIERVNEVLSMHMGPEYVLVTISADFHDDIRAAKLEQTIARIERAIRQRYPEVKRIFIEAEAAPRA